MIKIEGLSKSFGEIQAVNQVSFEVAKGERLVLLGTSGCGKTTTLKMINRLIEPDSGTVLIEGEPHHLQPAEELRRRMGYVMQSTGLFPHYTIEQNVSVVPDLLKWNRKKTKQRAAELLAKFQLDPNIYLPLYPDQLSGGQQQRVGFARALMADPPVLLMDEPLGALDPVTRVSMRKEFKTLQELREKTIILVTHDIGEAIELGDRICIMDAGRIQQTGTAVDLLLRPGNDFVKNFLAHDRFVLQLKALRIKDIFHLLEPAGESETTAFDLTGENSLNDAISILSGPNKPSTITVSDEEHRHQYRLTLSSTMRAFQQKIQSDE